MAGSRLMNALDRRPEYPGRERVGSALRPVVEHVAGKWVRHHADRQVLRLVGFHEVWHALDELGEDQPTMAMIERGIVARGTAFDAVRHFRQVFGVDVHEVTRAEVLKAVGVRKPIWKPRDSSRRGIHKTPTARRSAKTSEAGSSTR